MSNHTFAVIRVSGPAWDEALPMRAQAGWDDHARFMDGLTDSGFILLGGPLEDGREFLLIVTAESEQQVRETFQEDPWEPVGILTTKQIRLWKVLLDSRKQ